MFFPFKIFFQKDRTEWMNKHGITTNELEWTIAEPVILTIFIGIIVFISLPIVLYQDYTDYQKAI